MSTQTAFHNLPSDAFPFVINYLDPETGDIVDKVEVKGPGAVYVPGRSHAVDVRVDFANGTSSFQSHKDLP